MIGHYLPRGVLEEVSSHRNGIEFNNKTLRAKYVFVQYIAGSENRDDMSVENEICSTVIQKLITEIK